MLKVKHIFLVMESSINFRVNIYCVKDVKRFSVYESIDGKKLYIDATISSFTQTGEELKQEVLTTYTKNNVEEGWFSVVEF